MAKLLNPKLFSQYFGIPKSALDQADLLDPFLNADTKLFIDPLLLANSTNDLIKTKGRQLFRKRLADIMELVMASKSNDDPAWKAALRLLNLNERRETGLGYGGSGVSGSSRPDTLKTQILNTTRDIMALGITNPEIISLMGIFEEDVGPDTISDLTTNAIFPVLNDITLDFCKGYDIPVKSFLIGFDQYSLPMNPFDNSHGFTLVPKDILRELPVATDWSDIDRVVQHNAMLRHKVNQLVANIAKATVTQKKRAIRTVALSSEHNFHAIFDGLLSNNPTGYDFKRDQQNIEALRELLSSTPRNFPKYIAAPLEKTAAEIWRVVNDITAQFKKLIEDNDLSRLLWDGSKPKSEKAAQLVFFGIADSYCKANNIDISPEVHSGGGPVDFKFSSGYQGRLLVEMKLSTGAVVHGYEKQIEVYKNAANATEGLFLIVDVGKMGNKLSRVIDIHLDRIDRGERPTKIVLINAKKQPSASKR
jgi:hypothetical protein